MRTYLGLLISRPRLLIAELFRIVMMILPFGVFALCVLDWGLTGVSRTLLITLSVIAITLATIARRLSTGVWVSLYAWAMRIAKPAPQPWRFPLAILWAELTPAQYLRRWRALMGWSRPEQALDDSLALRAAHDVGAGVEAPLLLLSRITAEATITQLLRRYHDELVRVFGTANVGPTLFKRDRIFYFALPFVAGLVLFVVAAAGAADSSGARVVMGIVLIAVSLLLFFLQMSAYELSRLRMVEILVDASLTPDVARERLMTLGFTPFKDSV